ncbi:c-type cytochrome [Blattabacterium cuenoti]|uniref:c-type cytochrome n=1 Tax=Blattabacterium cuenoti TaxID=1653831 RepID=UPI00163CBDDB|nr:cytochrome c [Blattabacterium cuenoti]
MNNKYFLLMIFIIFIINSCWWDKSKPNIVYMPDMYYSDAYEPYSDPYPNYKKYKKIYIKPFLKHDTSSLVPVKGTISRNNFFYEKKYLNTNNIKKYYLLKSPLQKGEELKNIQNGQSLYKINCSICHGDNGDGQGILVKNEKILGIPNYKDRDLTIGSIYYVITYGKNNMSSYASQLNEIDRWKVAEYVMFLKKNK